MKDALLSFDTSELSQEQINYIPAALVQLLHEAGTTHSGILKVGPLFVVKNPSNTVDLTLEEVIAMQEEQAAWNAAHDDGT